MTFTRRFKVGLVFVCILIVGGFATFVYGLTELPTKVPDDFEPLPQMNFNPNAEERQLIQNRMSRYQLQSFPFKLSMLGLGVCVLGFAFLCMAQYCCAAGEITPEEHRAIASSITPPPKRQSHSVTQA